MTKTKRRQPRKQRKATTATVRFPELVSAIHLDSEYVGNAISNKLVTGVMKAQAKTN